MRLEGERIYLKLPDIRDTEAMLELHIRNRKFFQKYSPLREDSFYTLAVQFEAVKNSIYEYEKGRRYSFGIFRKDCDLLIGNVTLAEVNRGALENCMLGYFLDRLHNGKGYMSEAVGLAVDFAFNELKLHRIEAGVMPHNIASAHVLEKAGFHREGLAVKNVKINDNWEDHQVFALIDDGGSEITVMKCKTL